MSPISKHYNCEDRPNHTIEFILNKGKCFLFIYFLNLYLTDHLLNVQRSPSVSHLSSCLTVMLLHNEQSLIALSRSVLCCVINKSAAEPHPIGDVIRAAAPVPALTL